MKTNREKLQKEANWMTLHLSRRGRKATYTVEDCAKWNEIEERFFDSLKTVLMDDSGALITHLYAPFNTIFDEKIEDSHNVLQLEKFLAFLEQKIKNWKKRKLQTEAFEKGYEFGKNHAMEEVKDKGEYGVAEFAKLVGRHPNSIRSDYHKGIIRGRKDTKGIWIYASEIVHYIGMESNE